MTPTPVFLSGEPHEQRSLAGYSPWGGKKLNTTGTHTHTINPMHIHTNNTFMKMVYFPKNNQWEEQHWSTFLQISLKSRLKRTAGSRLSVFRLLLCAVWLNHAKEIQPRADVLLGKQGVFE